MSAILHATVVGAPALRCMRFKRSPTQVLGSKLFHRREVNARLPIDRALDRGAFLAPLWALFGAPARRDGGFEYILRDVETGLDFTAYANGKGPCYGGEIHQREQLRRVLEALEVLLDKTPPAACAFEYVADVDHGGATWVVGWRDGRSFDMPDRRTRKRPHPTDRRAQRTR
jgi:hypothetical protein